MKQNKFTIYLYFCVTLFCFLLSLVMFYTFGYQIDIKTGETIQTGGIVIKTPIKNVSVYKDGEILKKNGFISDLFTDFIKIENLKPGDYKIEVKKEDYQTWEKNVEIVSGKVEKFENIILLKNYYERQVISDFLVNSEKKFQYSVLKNQIAYINEGQQSELYLIDLEKEVQVKVLDTEEMSLIGEIQNIYWTENSNLLMIETQKNHKNNLYLVEIEDNKIYALSEDITNVLRKREQNYFPDIFDNFIIFLKDDSLFAYNYKNGENKQILDGIRNFAMQKNNIYFFKNNDDEKIYIFKANLNNVDYEVKFAEIPTNSNFDISQAFTFEEQDGRLLLLNQNLLSLIDKDGNYKEIEHDIKKAYFFKNGKQILMYNDSEIFIYYTEDKSYQPSKKKGERELITRFSGDIGDIHLYQDEEHLIYKEDNVLKFSELDDRYNRNIQIISEGLPEVVFYIKSKDYLYSMNETNIFKMSLELNK